VREAQNLSILSHPNIIKFFTSFVEDGCFHIIMEYAPKGDLHHLVRDQKEKQKYISEQDLWYFALQILNAIAYMHS
jgi:serine/threonine protein kinase